MFKLSEICRYHCNSVKNDCVKLIAISKEDTEITILVGFSVIAVVILLFYFS